MTTTTKRRLPLMGGYQPADIHAEPVLSAAQFALTELQLQHNLPPAFQSFVTVTSGKNTSIQVVDAKQQVVAGMNYALLLRVVDDDTQECLATMQVLIYDQFGTLRVTRWGEIQPCVEGDEDMEGNSRIRHLRHKE
eukprot:CAMPEP_0116851028 /NCGR_PEP_ID=MMETSP0418-20121206/16486_1 /TAXON_ID=1158023 /ORGANISM="Astrosyne radiata, Strain 13vi08-1A" /LENGTH=135 /DNA_ID=CAMNT_0004482987 /DNA_START=96 /DNA_END=503 /DNA_ORIENTATION=+